MLLAITDPSAGHDVRTRAAVGTRFCVVVAWTPLAEITCKCTCIPCTSKNSYNLLLQQLKHVYHDDIIDDCIFAESEQTLDT